MGTPSTKRVILPLICFLAVAEVQADPDVPGVIDLAGRWRLSAESGAPDPAAEAAPRWVEARLPASWQELGLTGYDGEVRFSRRVVVPEAWRPAAVSRPLAVLIDGAEHGTYGLLVGGQLVGSHGGAGLELPTPSIEVFDLPPDTVGAAGELSLELRFVRVRWASDLAPEGGTMGRRILVGDRESIAAIAESSRQRSRRAGLHSVLIATLLAAAGLYHLQLYSRRRERIEYLWFGLAAIDFAVVVFAVRLGSRLSDSVATGWRVSSAAVHLAVVLLIQLLWPYLGRPIGRWLRRYQQSHLVIALATLVLPIHWVVVSSAVRWLWIVPLLAGLGTLLAVGSWRGDPDARAIGLGGLALGAAGITEMIFQVAAQGTSHPLPAWAFGFFALSMAISLSNRYSRAHVELDQMRHDLEQKVEDATAELQATNRQLRAEDSERQLAEGSMRMLERAVEQSIDGIVVTDLAGSTQFLNEAWARLHGYEVPEILGYDLNLFHTREQMQREVYPLLNEVRERGSFNGEIGHRCQDGSTFPTWMTANLLRDPDGEAVGIVAIARDISQRRQNEREQLDLEAKVQQAAKLESLGDLAAGIAHDYNNLLTGMIAHANMVLRELPEESPLRDKVRQIDRAAVRAADLSDQLLAFAGEDEPRLETVALDDLLRRMEGQLRERIPEEVLLQFQLKKELPLVDVDPGQLQRVVLRLVTNAADAIGASPGVITLRTSQVKAGAEYFQGAQPTADREPGSYAFFEVSDSGVGIDFETRSRMFDPFFTTKSVGRGLGLATVLGIVGAHRGAIKVYSEPGRGTTFEVLFPASARRRTATPSTGPEEWQGAGAILVVDDEDLVLEVTREILQGRGFEVLAATSGRQALELFEDRRDISAVVLDMTMPEMDGEEVFERLRRIDPQVRVVLMSGYSRKKISKRIFDMGLGGFLHKPFRPQDLLDKLHAVLQTPA